jgi:lysophospholipase L1-like esterase
MKILIKIIIFMIIVLGEESFANCTLGANIINSSSFEDVNSLNNWSRVLGSANIVRADYSTGWAGDAPNGAGNTFLYATAGNDVTVEQIVNISSCMSGDNKKYYDFSAFLGGYGDGDTIAVKLEFKDKNNIVLDTYNTEDFTSSKRMTSFTNSALLSNNVNSVTVSLTFKRASGTDIDGYIDNLSIIIKEVNTYSCTLGTNIINDGSFEDANNLNDWNKASGLANIVRANYSTGWAGNAPSGAGSYFLYATAGNDVTVEQTVDISGCMSGDNNKYYDFSAFLGGYGDGDTIAVKLEFKDENNNIVTSYNSGEYTSSKEMTSFTNSDSISNSIKSLTVSLTFRRVSGTDIDGYVDDLSIIIHDTIEPLKIISPKSNYIQIGDNLSVNLNNISLNEGWGIKVILDKDTSNEQIDIVHSTPYNVEFNNISVGEHTVDAYIVDENEIIQNGQGNHDSVSNIGTGGDIIVTIGDSITYGYADDDISDNVSNDGRNSGGGYTPILNNILTQRLDKPHTIYNEGVEGDSSAKGLSILVNILDKYPNATKYLVMFGTNDARSYEDINRTEYKSNMQQIIDLIKSRGKIPILAKIPRVLGEYVNSNSYEEDGIDPEEGARNIKIKEFNIVIQELIDENNIVIESPEFYSYFRDTYGDTYTKENQDGYADNLHPDGLGYKDMANIWANSLTF